MKLGKYILVCDKRAVVTTHDPDAIRYKWEGYITSRGLKVLHTAWDDNGHNIHSKRHKIRGPIGETLLEEVGQGEKDLPAGASGNAKEEAL